MYSVSSVLTQPANSRQLLWRYFPYERLRDLLLSEELFFTHLPSFTDGLEGSLTTRSRDKLFHWFCQHGSSPAAARLEVEQYEKHQEAFFANCWHMNNTESYLMWKVYANRGFAVRTTYERIQASFELFSGVITGGVVNYLDFDRDITDLGNVFNHVVTKDIPYQDEREFRLLFWQPDPRNAEIRCSTDDVRVRVDLKMLIESMYVSPFEKKIPDELQRLMESRGLEYFSSLIRVR